MGEWERKARGGNRDEDGEGEGDEGRKRGRGSRGHVIAVICITAPGPAVYHRDQPVT